MGDQSTKHFLIITGLSGSGKTLAGKSFEEMGFFVVDNLPAPLLPRFAELVHQTDGSVRHVCLVVDLRSEQFGEGLEKALEELENLGVNYQILFMEASDETLVNRFKESRRQHPLALGGSIYDAIQIERQKLKGLRGLADRVIDTSRLSEKELRKQLQSMWKVREDPFSVSITSFGFKNGIPMDADLVMDVRFIDNPYYHPELRPLTGRDPAVRDYVLGQSETKAFLAYFIPMIVTLLPFYEEEGKSHLSIAIGCTGGQHRSIAIAESVAKTLDQEGYQVTVSHRDH